MQPSGESGVESAGAVILGCGFVLGFLVATALWLLVASVKAG